MSSLASSASVSAMNTTEGSLARIISPSSFPVCRFPSPRQFHTRQFMATGGAEYQPPPIFQIHLHHSLKPGNVCWVLGLIITECKWPFPIIQITLGYSLHWCWRSTANPSPSRLGCKRGNPRTMAGTCRSLCLKCV